MKKIFLAVTLLLAIDVFPADYKPQRTQSDNDQDRARLASWKKAELQKEKETQQRIQTVGLIISKRQELLQKENEQRAAFWKNMTPEQLNKWKTCPNNRIADTETVYSKPATIQSSKPTQSTRPPLSAVLALQTIGFIAIAATVTYNFDTLKTYFSQFMNTVWPT